MRGKKLKNLFVSIVSVITIMTGALLAVLIGSADLSYAVQKQSKINPDYDLGGGAPVIRIGTWYAGYDLYSLKAFLARQFPDYIFEFEYVDKSNYEPIMDAKLSSKEAPDILYVDREMAQKHAMTGYILEVTDLCHDFTEEAKLSFSYGNAIYAVPNTSQFECIYYNKKLFEEKTVAVPTSFMTLIGSSDELRVVKRITPLSVSLKDPYMLADTALGILAADYFSTDRGRGFGGRLQYGRTTFQKEIQPLMSDWSALLNHRILTNDQYTMDKLTAIEQFVNEESAMIVGGPETYNAIMQKNPLMIIGTMPFFGTSGENKAIIGGCDLGFAINAASLNQEIAIEVLRALTTYDGQQALWIDRPGSMTYLKGVSFANSQVYDGIEECYDKGLVFTPWMDWGFQLNKQIHYKFGRELQKVLLGRESLNEALCNTDELVSEILKME